ncbi:MBOAT family O-acyltransferase [Campylobacter porcelli]|uniref:Membrane bound O-acyl transferase, MBOAT family n=1 Tax=Campylobacter porcelli TaxID=1660073 RepID=A0A1X9SWA0_9BACT|nr:MBOAT family O-acyltransferase [Campylobacter sp. RM6137]ARR00483.1 membrane bound O-acyl transferase, MBOAT family [Campylobacter sp. RM6137]
MIFSSYAFIFGFLPIMLFGFYLLKYLKYHRFSNIFLVLGSLFFYGFWNLIYIPLLLGSILINYIIAKRILTPNLSWWGGVKLALIFGIIFNLGLLGFFKYTDFFLENFNLFSQILNLNFNIPLPHIVLPLAISFFTFQQIAFLTDCYKKVDTNDLQEGSKNIDFIDYCLFVSFFPQLIAGPIVHHKEMMPQFKANETIKIELIAKGVFIFCIGIFKKIFIADSFAKWANAGFGYVENGGILNIVESWVTSLSYTFQLYFDFSGYCDMAIGLGLMFGIILPMNFNSPYKSLSITEFWRRWHITLGRFLKDYLYIPLGGNKFGKILTLRNLFIVAFLSGIWHGSGWGFVIWGTLHGLAMVIHRIYSYYSSSFKFINFRVYKVFCWFITFNFLNITWIFFRSQNLDGALNLLKGMFGIVWIELPQKLRFPFILEHIGGRNDTIIYLILAFIITLIFKNSIEMLNSFKPNLKNAIFAGFLLYLALITLSITPYVEFIYFNF